MVYVADYYFHSKFDINFNSVMRAEEQYCDILGTLKNGRISCAGSYCCCKCGSEFSIGPNIKKLIESNDNKNGIEESNNSICYLL